MSYRPKIGVYAIMKNEADNVEAWATTVQDADHVTVLDTGSTDKTQNLLDRALSIIGVKRFQILQGHIRPWRFDVGHNAALALMPAEIDICIPLAADERMNRDWYDCVQDSIPAGSWLLTQPYRRLDFEVRPTKFTYRYEFAPGMSFTHDRIHTRDGFHWRYPFHEGVYPHAEGEQRIHVKGLKITQTQNVGVDRMSRDLALAEVALREFPNDPRMIFYAGRQFMYAGQIERAIATLERYAPLARGNKVDHPVQSAWVAEALANCYRMQAKARGL